MANNSAISDQMSAIQRKKNRKPVRARVGQQAGQHGHLFDGTFKHEPSLAARACFIKKIPFHHMRATARRGTPLRSHDMAVAAHPKKEGRPVRRPFDDSEHMVLLVVLKTRETLPA